MLLTEYNERKYMRMFRKEAQEEGREEGRKEGLQEGREEGREEGLQEGLQKGQDILLCVMLQNGASVDQLSKWTGLPPKKIEKARKSQKPGKSNRKRVRKP